jgi:hypothetical protein
MPILLWYLPFSMFYGACDLMFAELEMQNALLLMSLSA